MSQRMYEPGVVIVNLTELLDQTWVFFSCTDKLMHIEAVKSLQLRTVLDLIRKRQLYKAIKKM